jgi:CubicO group peptidase (beta-lactamase class C family)
LELVVATHTNSNVPDEEAGQQVSNLVGVIVQQLLPAVSDRRVFTVTGVEVPELAAFDDALKDLMQEYDLRAGQIAIAKDGRLVLAHGYTWDQPEVTPVTPTTLFRVGDISKSITSIAVHQLIEQGLLTYDTPAASALGLEPPPGQTPDPSLELVTVDHLLTHTVGWDINEGGIDPMVFQDGTIAAALGTEPPPTREEIATFMAGQPFQFDPGTSWGYCNVGYLLLDLLSEKATGSDFVELVSEEVFRRAGVGRARMAHTAEEELYPGEATPEGVFEGDPFRLTQENLFAAGSQMMAAPDLARVLSVLFDEDDGGGLLTSETIDDMLALPFPASQALGYGRGWIHEDLFVATGHTLGWLTDPTDGMAVFGHSGGGPGVQAVAVWRTDGTVFVWMTNKDPLVPNLDTLPEVTAWPDHDL